MIQHSQDFKNRRQFLKDGLRTALFGGLTLTGGFLWWRGRSQSGTDSPYVLNIPCRDCFILPDCQDPRAISAREELRDEERGA